MSLTMYLVLRHCQSPLSGNLLRLLLHVTCQTGGEDSVITKAGASRGIRGASRVDLGGTAKPFPIRFFLVLARND